MDLEVGYLIIGIPLCFCVVRIPICWYCLRLKWLISLHCHLKIQT